MKKISRETTFKETFKFLEAHGWKRIRIKEYLKVKKERKFDTSRIGAYGFFKLKISKEEIKDKQTDN